MGMRFRKSFKVAPGLRVTLSKDSVGASAGVRGARVSANSKGRKTFTSSIPGTGVSFVETISNKPAPAEEAQGESWGFVFWAVLILGSIVWFYHG
jgi:hypothetical protein